MSTAQQSSQPQIAIGSRKGLQFQPLIEGIEALTQQVMDKIDAIRKRNGEGGEGKEMSIGDMFDLQMTMNKLQQFSEMSTSVLSALNGSINSMARNVKG